MMMMRSVHITVWCSLSSQDLSDSVNKLFYKQLTNERVGSSRFCHFYRSNRCLLDWLQVYMQRLLSTHFFFILELYVLYVPHLCGDCKQGRKRGRLKLVQSFRQANFNKWWVNTAFYCALIVNRAVKPVNYVLLPLQSLKVSSPWKVMLSSLKMLMGVIEPMPK